MSIPYGTWFLNVEMIVQAFADKEFQIKAWGGEISTSFNSPEEMMCVYFDDVIVPDFIIENASILGSECVSSGLNLTAILEQYPWPMVGEFIDSNALIEQQEWGAVLDAAIIFLGDLRKTKAGSFPGGS